MKIKTNKLELEKFFKDLEWRGIISAHANLDNFLKLENEEKIVYLGIDATAESLHIGHLFLIIQCFRFIKENFKVLLVIGGATSKIGDPSDKLKERPQLKYGELIKFEVNIEQQLKHFVLFIYTARELGELSSLPLEQFYSDNSKLLNKIHQILELDKEEDEFDKWNKFLSFILPPKSKGKFVKLNNQEWLKNEKLIDFIDQTAKHISVNYLLAKETIKQRIGNEDAGLSLSAFLYSTLQAFDFLTLHKYYQCQGQIGGSDQWGNITTGLELIRKVGSPNNKTFAFTFNLMTDKEGKKLSKSENNGALRLDSDKKEFFDFFRNMPDGQAEIFLKQFTFLSEEQVNELLKLNNPKKLRIPQRILLELVWFLNFKEVLKKENYVN